MIISNLGLLSTEGNPLMFDFSRGNSQGWTLLNGTFIDTDPVRPGMALNAVSSSTEMCEIVPPPELVVGSSYKMEFVFEVSTKSTGHFMKSDDTVNIWNLNAPVTSGSPVTVLSSAATMTSSGATKLVLKPSFASFTNVTIKSIEFILQ